MSARRTTRMNRRSRAACWSLALATLLGARGAGAQQSVAPEYAALDSGATPRSPALAIPVTIANTESTRRDVIRLIAGQAGLSIVFDAALPGLGDRIVARYAAVPAATALLRTLAGSGTRALISPSGAQVVLVATARDERVVRRLTGTVRSADGPVAAARVELLGTGHRALTHDDGGFALPNVWSGDYPVRVSRLGYRPVRETLHVPADGEARVELTMTREAMPLAAVVVTPGYFGLLEGASTTPQSMSREQLETVPQIGEDIYRAINRLPGVGASDFSARFSVRGATADQLYVTLDGLRLIEPFHLKDIGSALSIIDIGTLGEASLVSGGASAAFGDQIGGVFAMRSLDPRADRTHTSLGASLTNLRASSQGSFAGGRGGWLVSGRRGFLDLVFRLTSLGDSLRPRYDDAFAKVQYDLPHDGQVAVHALHSGDDLRYLDTGEESIDTRYRANYLWLTLRQPLGARWRSETVLSMARLDWRRAGQSGRFVSPSGTIADDRSLVSLEARQDWSFRAADRALIAVGADLRHDDARYDYERQATRAVVIDGRVESQAESVSAHVRPRGSSLGLYLSGKVQPVDALTIEPGLRFDDAAGVRERIVSPRLGFAWRMADATTLRGSWGRYAQAQPLFALSVQDGEQGFSPADRSDQAELGLERTLPAHLTVRVNAYARQLWSNRPRYLNATSGISSFPEISYDRVTVPPSTGQSRGLELLLGRTDGGRTDWTASYALARATDDIGGRAVPRAEDQRHTAHFDWSYHPVNNAWRLAVAGVWHTGTPDTPEIIRIDTLVNTNTQFSIFAVRTPGPLYSERVPAYRRLDIRWTRYFETRTGRVSVFGELFNALDAENPRGYYTNVEVSGRKVGFVRGMRAQLPRLPSVGLTWEF
jgi:outer membrane cobalamin receptor